MKKMNKKGFTIVELVIVIAVIAILAAVLIPTFSGVVNKANLSAAEQSARNGITAGLQMTSNAVLPEGTKIIVDSDKNGTPDYAFNYTGNAMESCSLYNEDGTTIVNTILNSATETATKGSYYKFNNILVCADHVSTKYVAVTGEYDSTKTYYTTTDSKTYTKTAVADADLNNGAWKDDTAKAKYYVAEIELDSVVAGDMIKIATACGESSATQTSTEDGKVKFGNLEFNVYTSTDMPVNTFVLMYVKAN